MKFKAYAVIHFLVQGVSIQACSTLVGQFVQIVSLKLDAVNLVVSAQLLYLLLSFLRWQLVLTVLIAGELLEEILLAELSSPLLFGAKVLGDREERHDGVALYVVGFHLVEHLAGVCQSLGNVLEHFVHLLTRLEPLLFGVQHTCGVVQILAGGQAEQVVMRFGIILVHEVAVVGADELDAVFAGQFYEPFVGFLLQGECLAVGSLARVFDLMPLQLQVVVVAEEVLEPLHTLLRPLDVASQNLARNLSRYACRAADEVLVEAFQVGMIGSRLAVESIYPGAGYQLYQVLVAMEVLGQQYQVVAAQVQLLVRLLLLAPSRHIHLAAEDRFEWLQTFLLAPFVYLSAIVKQVLDAKHIAMVGERHSSHAVLDCLIHHAADTRLAVEQRVLRVNMKVYEIFHRAFSFLQHKDSTFLPNLCPLSSYL